MSTPLTHESLAASLFSHWANAFPLAVTTLYPGTRIDTSGLLEWLELWIDTWSPPAQRQTAKQRIALSLTVHCFVKPSLDKSRLYELADAVRITLAQQTIPLHDHQSSGRPLIGYATLQELESRELTRNHIHSLQQPLRHLTLTCQATAQQI